MENSRVLVKNVSPIVMNKYYETNDRPSKVKKILNRSLDCFPLTCSNTTCSTSQLDSLIPFHGTGRKELGSHRVLWIVVECR